MDVAQEEVNHNKSVSNSVVEELFMSVLWYFLHLLWLNVYIYCYCWWINV